MTSKQRVEIILSLSVQDYCSGPTSDKYKLELWVFGKHVDGVEVYIKFKIADREARSMLFVFPFIDLNFHCDIH